MYGEELTSARVCYVCLFTSSSVFIFVEYCVYFKDGIVIEVWSGTDAYSVHSRVYK